MKLFYSLVVAAVVSVLPAQAKDLLEGQVIGHMTRNISIQDVVEARIAEQKVQVNAAGENVVSSANLIVEVTLKVEGNLCGSSADDASIVMSRLEGDQVRLRLASLSRENDPYKLIMKACAAYSAPRTVKAVFSVNSYVFKKEVKKIVYLLGDDKATRKLVFTHSVADGVNLVLE